VSSGSGATVAGFIVASANHFHSPGANRPSSKALRLKPHHRKEN
jgi:hypothetical protein